MTTSSPRPRRRRWAKPLMIVGIVLALGAAWAWFQRKPPPPPPPSDLVKLADVTQSVQAGGLLQAKTKVDVGAQVSGLIQQIHVQLGQRVKKGELLVNLDPELARSDVAQAEAALAQQLASMDARRVDLRAAKREWDRQQRLLGNQATAATEAEKAQNEVDRLEADLRGQAATAQRLQADLDKRRVSLGYTRISAPMDGTVVSLPVQAGQTIIAIQVPPVLMTLADLDTITVKARVPEADIQSVKTGQPARFTTLAGEARRYEGRVNVVQPVPERIGNAAFYNVLFDVDNRDGRLFSDMTVQVEIITGEARQVPTLPVIALGERDAKGLYTVQLMDAAGQVKPRQVRVGLQDGAKAQVLDGLKVGDKLSLAPPPAASAPSGAH